MRDYYTGHIIQVSTYEDDKVPYPKLVLLVAAVNLKNSAINNRKYKIEKRMLKVCVMGVSPCTASVYVHASTQTLPAWSSVSLPTHAVQRLLLGTTRFSSDHECGVSAGLFAEAF